MGAKKRNFRAEIGVWGQNWWVQGKKEGVGGGFGAKSGSFGLKNGLGG